MLGESLLLLGLLAVCDLTVTEGSSYTVPAGGNRTVCLDGGEDGIFDFSVNQQLLAHSANTGKITWTMAPGTTAVRNDQEKTRNFWHLNDRGPVRLENIVAIGNEFVSFVSDEGGDSIQIVNCDGVWQFTAEADGVNDAYGVYIRGCDLEYDFRVEDVINIAAALDDDPASDCYYDGRPLNFYSTSEVYRFFMDDCTIRLNAGIGMGGGSGEDYVLRNYAFSGQMDSVTVYNHGSPVGDETVFQWFCSNFTLSNSRVEVTNAERIMTIRGYTDVAECLDEPLYYLPTNNTITNCVFVNYGNHGNGVALDCTDTSIIGCSVFAPGNYGSTAHVVRSSEEGGGNVLSNSLFVCTDEGQAILNQGPGLLTIENCSIYTTAEYSYDDEWGPLFHTKAGGDSTKISNCLFVDGYGGSGAPAIIFRDRSLVTFETTPDYLEFDSNVFQTYGSSVPFRVEVEEIESIAELQSSYQLCTGNIMLDHIYYTEMVDPRANENGDFHLHQASRSVDFGLSVRNDYPQGTDRDGEDRTQGDEIDAGAFELLNDVVPTGACCWPNEPRIVCSILTLADCQSRDGSYKGDSSVCVPNPCTSGGGGRLPVMQGVGH